MTETNTFWVLYLAHKIKEKRAYASTAIINNNMMRISLLACIVSTLFLGISAEVSGNEFGAQVSPEDEFFFGRLLQESLSFPAPTPRPNLRPPTAPPTPQPNPGPTPRPPPPTPATDPTPAPDTSSTLTVELVGPGSAFPGSEFDFTVTVGAVGATTVNTILTVDLPTEGTFVLSDPVGMLSGSTLTFELGDISVGESIDIDITWQAPDTEATLITMATASADNAETVSEQEQVEVGMSSTTTGGVSSAGTGLRNRAGGTISITDIPDGATVTRAVLVWAILYRSANGVPGNQITLEGTVVTANLEQTVSEPLCWGDDSTIGYAADVTNLVNGNGDYRITNPVNGLVREDSNPRGTLPYTDGASVFVFYRGPGVTSEVYADFSYTAVGSSGIITRAFTEINSGGTSILHLAGPDGQNNFEEDIAVEASGAGMLRFDDTWDGSAPQDGPDFEIGNLWDNDIHDVSEILPDGQTSLDITIRARGDCVGLSGAALAVGV